MNASTRPRNVLVLLALFALFISPVMGQVPQNVFLTVQTDEAVLGRIISVIEVPDIGQYSVTITRGTSLRPAKAGDTLFSSDVITLQRGAFANLQLVDRAEPTMLGGGTDGLAARIRSAGPASVAKTVKSTVTPLLYATERGNDCGQYEKGKITYVQGSAYVQRNARLIPASVGDVLLSGDTLIVEKGSEVTIELEDAGRMKLSGETRFQIPCETEIEVGPEGLLGSIESFFEPVTVHVEDLWMKFKEILAGESFGVKEDTAEAGVRG